MGVLQASGDRGLYSIGVDTNQNNIIPGHVAASDIKDVGMAIINVYKTIDEKTYVQVQFFRMDWLQKRSMLFLREIATYCQSDYR
jgi:basic membrane lipoprotein Med (substrate-binding protein (PBP1-ABC) superfamily)